MSVVRTPWHEPAWQRLMARRASATLPHALLLCGASGLGKRVFATELASALLCQTPRSDGHACGECRACRLIAAGSHPDFVRVELGVRDDGKPRIEIIVDQIRALSERLAMTAQFGGAKVAIVDPADAMNANASNALLKTLEEPSDGSMLVLVADQPARLSATIRSRCQRIDFHVPSHADAVVWLTEQGIATGAAETALTASGGNPGLALTWLRGNGMALRAEVAADLRAVCARQVSTVDVANRWGRAEPESRLWFAAALLREESVAHAQGVPGPLALTSRGDFTKLSSWFDRANRARALLPGPLRPELVVLEALSALQLG